MITLFSILSRWLGCSNHIISCCIFYKTHLDRHFNLKHRGKKSSCMCQGSRRNIDILSSGRLFAGVGPGSHEEIMDVCEMDFSERWSRFSEALQIFVMLPSSNNTNKSIDYKGKYYTLRDIILLPKLSKHKNLTPQSMFIGVLK